MYKKLKSMSVKLKEMDSKLCVDNVQEIFYNVDFDTYIALSRCSKSTQEISLNYLYTIPPNKCELMIRLGRFREFVINRTIYRLDLSFILGFTDVSMLGGLHYIDLSGTEVEDVSALGGLHSICLSGTDVTDVSMLGYCHTVDVSSTRVTDVSMLGYCHTVDVSSTRVKDVSMLGYCHSVFARGSDVTDVSMLGYCHTVDVSNTGVEDVSMLGYCHTVLLRGSNVVDVSNLSEHNRTLNGYVNWDTELDTFFDK